MHKLKPKTRNKVANRKRKLTKEAKGWKAAAEYAQCANTKLDRIEKRIDILLMRQKENGKVVATIDERTADITARIPWKRPASEMVIRVKGRRKEQFLKALEMYSKNPELGRYEISHEVLKVMPARGGDGYTKWSELYSYMYKMNLRYGCFG